jgi:hypothetical protein
VRREAPFYAGGTAEPVAYPSCSLRRNNTHLAEFVAMRKALARR